MPPPGETDEVKVMADAKEEVVVVEATANTTVNCEDAKVGATVVTIEEVGRVGAPASIIQTILGFLLCCTICTVLAYTAQVTQECSD